ncbi:hypothetical protein [Streptomyces sp. NPDC006193]|uniref:hypothetical protein n=1 Tax=Streptomyces sp. NPDC006193 TaxID=3155717 RepID=UPI0033AA4C59
MELDAVADELYALRPEEFVAARARYALEARTCGDKDLARRIGALRRPSLAAWVSNLLVHRLPEEVQSLLALGEQLRRAHRELNGPGLRTLARRQNEVIGALGRRAGQLAAQAGHPVGEGVRREVEGTLHAVLADPDAAREWAAGRLVRPLAPAVGFPASDETALGHRPATTAATPAAAPERARDERPPSRTDRAGDAERRRLLAEARRQARDAERELRVREKEAQAAQREAEEAGSRPARLERRAGELREELRRVQDDQRQARADEQAARQRARRADREAREARRRAAEAAAQLRRLTSG